MKPVAAAKKRRKFNLKTFLSTVDGGRTIATIHKKQTIFAQGDSADSVFYLQKGKVKLTAVSMSGKEATIGILNEGDFFGEGCLAGQTLRLFSATAMTDCTVRRRVPAQEGGRQTQGQRLFQEGERGSKRSPSGKTRRYERELHGSYRSAGDLDGPELSRGSYVDPPPAPT
jgi:hypothetical protein